MEHSRKHEYMTMLLQGKDAGKAPCLHAQVPQPGMCLLQQHLHVLMFVTAFHHQCWGSERHGRPVVGPVLPLQMVMPVCLRLSALA